MYTSYICRANYPLCCPTDYVAKPETPRLPQLGCACSLLGVELEPTKVVLLLAFSIRSNPTRNNGKRHFAMLISDRAAPRSSISCRTTRSCMLYIYPCLGSFPRCYLQSNGIEARPRCLQCSTLRCWVRKDFVAAICDP